MIVKLKINKPTAIFKDMDKKMQSFLEDEIARTTQDIADDARAIVRVDDGFLKGSIVVDSKGLEGEVRADKHYAPYVEFGTGGLVDVPEGIKIFALKFKGNNIKQINLTPRPFLFPAFFSNVEQMKKRLIEKLK